MRPTTLLSAALLLLISPAFAAPLAAPQDVHGVSANIENAEAPAPAGAPCTNSKQRRSWIPFWRRQTIVGVEDCGFMQGKGGSARLGFGK